MPRRVHKNKYAHLSENARKSQKFYEDYRTQKIRHLPVDGKPGEVVKAGLRMIWHGRLYELAEDVVIPEKGGPVLPLFRLRKRSI